MDVIVFVICCLDVGDRVSVMLMLFKLFELFLILVVWSGFNLYVVCM